MYVYPVVFLLCSYSNQIVDIQKMDKNTLTIPKSPFPDLCEQSLPRDKLAGGNPLHRAYGLQITHFARGAIALPLNHIRPRRFTFYSLCHLIDGDGWFWLPDQSITPVEPGQGILITPGMIFEYGGRKTHWREDYVGFTGSVAVQLHDAGVIQPGLVNLGAVRRLPVIIERCLDPSDHAQVEANMMLQQLLVDIYLARRQTRDPRQQQIIELCRRIKRDLSTWWTVSEMAHSCEVSVNHFRQLFQDVTGLSPKQWLTQQKIAHASELLCQTDLSVREIGQQVGFLDPYHFSRAFKQVTRLSPMAYRRTRRG